MIRFHRIWTGSKIRQSKTIFRRTERFSQRPPIKERPTIPSLMRSIRFAVTTTFSLSSATRRFMPPTISRASTIFMNLTAARKATGCTRSTNGSRTMAVPPTTCMTVIPSSGAIPVKVWEQMSGQTNGWDNREQ